MIDGGRGFVGYTIPGAPVVAVVSGENSVVGFGKRLSRPLLILQGENPPPARC